MVGYGLLAISQGAHAQDMVDEQVSAMPTQIYSSQSDTAPVDEQQAAVAAAQTTIEEAEPVILPENACELRVFPVQKINGLTKSSGLAKLAAVALPVAGAFIPGGPFTVQALAKGGAYGTLQGLAVDRTSDVPPAVANVFTPAYQLEIVKDKISAVSNLSNSAPIVIFEPGSSGYEYFQDELIATEKPCLRVLRINNVTLEHSKDYSKRNAIVFSGSIAQFGPHKRGSIIEAKIDGKTPLTTSPLADGEGKAQLEAEVRSAFEAAIAEAVQELSARHAKNLGS